MTLPLAARFARAHAAEAEAGQTMTEYAVVLGMITLLIVGAIAALSGGIINALNSAAGVL